jgi:MFS family permease
VSEQGTAAPETTTLWRNRNFLRYWISTQISSLGSQISLIAYPLLVLSLGMGAADAGLVTTCSMLTRLALQLLGGHLADQYDRRRLMLAGDLIRVLALGSIPVAAWLGHLAFAQLLVIAVIEGAATSLLFGPASSIAFRDVVPEEHIGAAISRVEAAQGAVMLLGPALGGALYALD